MKKNTHYRKREAGILRNSRFLAFLRSIIITFLKKVKSLYRFLFVDFLMITVVVMLFSYIGYSMLDSHYNYKTVRVKAYLYEGSIDYIHINKSVKVDSFSARWERYYDSSIDPYMPIIFYKIELIFGLYIFEYFTYPDEYRRNIGDYYEKMIKRKEESRRIKREEIERERNL